MRTIANIATTTIGRRPDCRPDRIGGAAPRLLRMSEDAVHAQDACLRWESRQDETLRLTRRRADAAESRARPRVCSNDETATVSLPDRDPPD